MKASNGSPASWPPPKTATELAIEEAEYQSVAQATDDSVSYIMDAAQMAYGSSPGAVVAGTVMALVRFSLRTMEVPKTVRNLFALLGPSINRAAEQIVQSTAERPEA